MSRIENPVFAYGYVPEFERREYSDITRVAMGGAMKGAKEILELHGLSSAELQIEYKVDAGMTPRTLADMRSGKAIKDFIKHRFPNHSINEEETGEEEGNEYTWHIDPLDGTSSYARGQGYSTIGVALYKGTDPLSACVINPFEREMLVSEKDKGAVRVRFDNQGAMITAEPLVVSDQDLHGGIVYVDALFNAQTMQPKMTFMQEVVKLGGNNVGFRMTGSNIDQQRQVAAGRAEATITDAVGGFFDLAAGALMVSEAGGRFTDLEGNPVTMATQVAIGSNGRQHDALLEIAQRAYQGYQGFK